MPTSRPAAATRQLMAQYHGLAVNLRDLETDLRWGLDDSPRIPEAWREIALRPVVPFKEKVSLRVDEDVVAFFKAMGRGYLTRMNDVLRAFMQARLAGVVTGPEEEEYKPTPLETYLAGVAELISQVSRRNARATAGLDVIADDMESDRRTIALVNLAEQIPPEYRIDLVKVGREAMDKGRMGRCVTKGKHCRGSLTVEGAMPSQPGARDCPVSGNSDPRISASEPVPVQGPFFVAGPGKTGLGTGKMFD